jgi:hypothetical protein
MVEQLSYTQHLLKVQVFQGLFIKKKRISGQVETNGFDPLEESSILSSAVRKCSSVGRADGC